ncbi:MAG: LacI family DNA-binding transcriptional regulator [Crocinitomicaceae bacterium]|nr:LacI family DNA-binding transcriptional regulator [Crocinitomicaceae bacterium]
MNVVSIVRHRKSKAQSKELNYIPNQYARGLRIGRTNTIGVIVPDISNIFYGKLCKAIEQEAYLKGYNLIISNTYEDAQKEKKLISDLINRNIDGLILASSFDDKNEIEGLRQNDFPLILVDRTFENFNVDSITVSNKEGASKAVEFLYRSGVKKPVCFTISPVYISSISDRIQGYLGALKNQHDAKLFQIPHNNIEEGVAAALAELKHQDFDGIFCVNNNIAKAILKSLAINGEGFENIKIISFDDIEVFDIVHPKISSISQPIEEMGKKAVMLLIDRFDNPEGHQPQQIVMDTVLIER